MKPQIVTIGVYGFDEQGFFQAMQNAHIDVLCDIRARRGVRGSDYAFANSARLQKKLAELNIRYIHLKHLAPSEEIRQQQNQEDKQAKIAKRQRSRLGKAFQEAYKQDNLTQPNLEEFLRQVGDETAVVGLLCVEREPEACHRSLVADWLAQGLGLSVEHIIS